MVVTAVADEFLRPLRSPGLRDSIKIGLWQWDVENGGPAEIASSRDNLPSGCVRTLLRITQTVSYA